MRGNNFVFLLNSHKLGMQRSKNNSCTQCKTMKKIICKKTEFIYRFCILLVSKFQISFKNTRQFRKALAKSENLMFMG